MGISDKDMADAITKGVAKIEIKERYSYGWTDPTVGAMVAPPPTKNWDFISQDDLKNEAMQVPLSALVDMWTIRFQGTWVKEDVFFDDNFWRLAMLRLLGANKLEKHRMVDAYNPVYRIIE
jgi:hypothetical protein